MQLLNSSAVSSFTLAAYLDLGPFRPLCFLLLLSLYAAIVCSNVLLILVIWSSRSLHEPMYLFLCSLFVNELYGSTGLFPFLLLQILSDVHTVSAPCCFLQIFCIFSYGTVEFMNLAVMSYDRYLAICCPLQYGSRMTPRAVASLIAASWFVPLQDQRVQQDQRIQKVQQDQIVQRVQQDQRIQKVQQDQIVQRVRQDKRVQQDQRVQRVQQDQMVQQDQRVRQDQRVQKDQKDQKDQGVQQDQRVQKDQGVQD
ncbi:uncharacterized protein V6R79_005708 [Siganus canaliculatus]